MENGLSTEVNNALATLGIKLTKAEDTAEPTKTKEELELEKAEQERLAAEGDMTPELVKAQIEEIKGTTDALKLVVEEVLKGQLDKAEGGSIEGLEDFQKSITDSITGMVEEIGNKFESLGVVEKAIYDNVEKAIETIDLQKAEIDTLKESIELIKADVEKMAEMPNPQRSFTSQAHIEKSFGEQVGLKEDEKVLSASKQKEEVLKALDTASGNLTNDQIQKGETNDMYKAALLYEASGSLSSSIIEELRTKHKIVIAA